MQNVILTLEEYNAMVDWTERMYAWAKQVNHAIHALEGHSDNPDDPPPPPWRPKP
jgi:hypothetical protein